ncbi:D-glycero-alpha-D-manno-heptose-1,7-bisphosphate 7-phosphatase [Luteimonas sp. RIT-PG2_3]
MNTLVRPAILGTGVRLDAQGGGAEQVRRRALFLDRDGIININLGYVHTPGQTRWVPGIFELARTAHDAGYLLIVVTNQAGIVRGYYSEEDFVAYTNWLHREFEQRACPLSATYYCPHHPSAGMGSLRVECSCRKPGVGMLKQAEMDWCLDMSASVLVGDSLTDLQAAAGAGIPLGLFCPGGDLRPVLEFFSRVMPPEDIACEDG